MIGSFVGTGLQGQRHLEAECLGGLEIDDKHEFGRPLNREIGGLGALEDRHNVLDGDFAKRCCRRVAHQAAVVDVLRLRIDGRDFVLRGQSHDPAAIIEGRDKCFDDKRAGPASDTAGSMGGRGDVAWLHYADRTDDRSDRLCTCQLDHGGPFYESPTMCAPKLARGFKLEFG
jgi:hypothetical protein